VEQLGPFGGIRNPVGWWRKRASSGAENATDVGGEFEKGLVMAERATAQYFPGLLPRSGPSISI